MEHDDYLAEDAEFWSRIELLRWLSSQPRGASLFAMKGQGRDHRSNVKSLVQSHWLVQRGAGHFLATSGYVALLQAAGKPPF